MSTTLSSLKAHAQSDTGRKAIRFTLVSLMVVPVAQSILFFFNYVLEWSARSSNLVGFCVGTLLSYYMNRYWAWGKRGRSHFLKEVLPFWGMALTGLLFSTFTVSVAENWAHDHGYTKGAETLTVMAANLTAFGIVWVVKFFVLNLVLFRTHPEVLEDAPALDGRTGIPT